MSGQDGTGPETTLFMPFHGPRREGDTASDFFTDPDISVSVDTDRVLRIEHQLLPETGEVLALRAVVAGALWFRPAADERPDTLVLRLLPADYYLFMSLIAPLTSPSGLLVGVSEIEYAGVEREVYLAAEGADESRVLGVGLEWWATSVHARRGSPPTPAERDEHLAAWLRGDTGVWVEGGEVIGQLAADDPNNPDEPEVFVTRLSLLSSSAEAEGEAEAEIEGEAEADQIEPAAVFSGFGGGRWRGHPLIDLRLAGARIHLAFETYDPTGHAYVPVPAGWSVRLMNEDTFGDEEVARASCDARGRVTFELDEDALDEGGIYGGIDIYFELVPGSTPLPGDPELPEGWTWSTLGWQSVSHPQLLSRLQDFRGGEIGSEAAPVVYRVGYRYDLSIEFCDEGINQYQRIAPVRSVVAGLTVKLLRKDLIGTTQLAAKVTNSSGRVTGMLYEIEANDEIHFDVGLTLTWDGSEASPRRITVRYPDGSMTDFASRRLDSWNTRGQDRSIVVANGPELNHVLRPNTKMVRQAFFVLETARNYDAMMLALTGEVQSLGDTSVELRLGTEVARAGPDSLTDPLQLGVVLFEQKFFQTEVIGHELTHVLFSQLIDTSVWEALGAVIQGHRARKHSFKRIMNPPFALHEGIADYFGYLLSRSDVVPFNHGAEEGDGLPSGGYTTLYGDGDEQRDLAPPSDGIGLSIEGCVVNVLSVVTLDYIVGSALSRRRLGAHYIPNLSGHGYGSHPWWADPGVVSRFVSVIWEPFLALRNLAVEDQHIGNMVGSLPASMRGHLYAWNILTFAPGDLDRITYPWTSEDPNATHIQDIVTARARVGDVVELIGGPWPPALTTFTSSRESYRLEVRVEIGGVQADPASVSTPDATRLVFTVPGPARSGPQDLRVVLDWTYESSAELSEELHRGAFHYA